MKTLWGILLGLFVLTSCRKQSLPPGDYPTQNSATWQLALEYNGRSGVNYPGADSVDLVLDSVNLVYASELNGRVTCSGSYSVLADTLDYGLQLLQLDGFRTTGIFQMFGSVLFQAQGQPKEVPDALDLGIFGDTLYLSTPPTPGGNIEYVFIRRHS
jgi:hypothetical protein